MKIKEQETKTRVLSDTERRDFDGVTIDEEGDTVQVEFAPTQKEEDRSGYEQFQDYGPRVKVYHFGGSSWLSLYHYDYCISCNLSSYRILWRHHLVHRWRGHPSRGYYLLYLRLVLMV